MDKPTCCHPGGCSRPARKLGWCTMHYQRIRAKGHPGPAAKLTTWGENKGRSCAVDGCRRPWDAGDYCGMHYKRVQEGRPLGGAESLRRDMPPDSKGWTPGERHRYYKYGLTPAMFDGLLAKQCGRCYICGTTEPNGKGWSVDHCHETNVVRFISCNPCNAAFGLIREDPEVARRLLDVCVEWQAAKAAQAS